MKGYFINRIYNDIHQIDDNLNDQNILKDKYKSYKNFQSIEKNILKIMFKRIFSSEEILNWGLGAKIKKEIADFLIKIYQNQMKFI